jgi:hypothetical protein
MDRDSECIEYAAFEARVPRYKHCTDPVAMNQVPPLLCYGRYEELKASVHGAVMTLSAVCAAYNFAAWVVRRQRHSWVNAGTYAALTVWEYHHVRHHLQCRAVKEETTPPPERAVA